MNYIEEYAAKIAAGEIIAGKWIKLLYEGILNRLNEGVFRYSDDKAQAAIDWIEEKCYHVEGILAPGNLKLELWEKAFISCVFGLLENDTEFRYFREIVLLVARKNGKSLLAAAIANYVLREDGGYGARVFNVAPKLTQADIIYLNTWQMIQLDPERQAIVDAIQQERKDTRLHVDDSMIVKKQQTRLFYPVKNSTMQKVAFSAKRSDGFNPNLAIMDEAGAWPGDQGLKVYEVFRSGMGAREEPLLLTCTTAGYENGGIYDELLKRSTRFLLGESEERRLLPFLYMIDDIEKWDQVEELAKSNPNLGFSVTEDYLKEEARIAYGSLSKRSEFIVKYCNLKQSSSQAWLANEVIENCYGDRFELENFRSCYCVAGIDLSQTTDLTAAVIVIEKTGELYVFAKFWLPAEKIQEATARDGVPYDIYIQRGLLDISGDNFVDYHDCYNWLVSLVQDYEILPLKVGYDRYSAQYLIQDLNAYGFQTDDVFQGNNLWPVLQEIEGLMKDGKIHIGNNDLLKIHMFNSAIKMDTERGRGKLIKLNPKDHVDGMAALADAMTVRQKWHDEIGGRLANESV